jgi:predicted component of type VI protein secretion system
MQLKLVITNKNSNEVSETLLNVEERVVIGRHVSSPVLLQGEALSRHHFSVALRDGNLAVENMSRNGTMLNGESLPVEGSSPLAPGDVLEVPGYEMRVELPEEGSSNSGEPETEAAAPALGTPDEKVPAWSKFIHAAAGFFDPLEIVLLLCALASTALATYYFLN